MPDISGAVNTATNVANNVTSNIENTLKAAAMSKLTDLMGKTGLSAQSLLNADPSSIANHLQIPLLNLQKAQVFKIYL